MARKKKTPKWVMNLDDRSLPLKYKVSTKMREWANELKKKNNIFEARFRRELNKQNINYIWQCPVQNPKENIYLIVDFMIWINGKCIIVECNYGKPLTYSSERYKKIKKICKDLEYITINEAISNKQQSKEILENISNSFLGIEQINEKVISRLEKQEFGEWLTKNRIFN